MVIEYMEDYAYEYGRDKNYIDKNSRKKVPMNKLFNMIAGTSTGGLVTAALSVPREKGSNESFYSDTLLDLYVDKGPEIFKKQSINKGLLGIITVLCIMFGAILGFKAGKSMYANPKVE